MIKYVSFISLVDFLVILLANFMFEVEMYEKIKNLTQITNIQNRVIFYLSRPNWNKSAPLTEDSFWNASGMLATTLHELKDIGIFSKIDNHTAEIHVNSLVDLKALYENYYDMFVKLKLLLQADLLDSVSYSVVKNNEEKNAFPVEDLSEGEKQVSLLLCFLTVTREYRSLFLVDSEWDWEEEVLYLDTLHDGKYEPFCWARISYILHWSDLSKYKIVIVPQMIIGKEETRNKLKEFAQNGGTVVMTYRSAVKDVDNN